MTMDELNTNVNAKALAYIQEQDSTITTFPTSIVDFVIEFAARESHFPNTYEDDDIANVFANYLTTLAMMCTEIYFKAGTEGETSHTEGNYSRHYESVWISRSLISALPNFVNVPSTLRV